MHTVKRVAQTEAAPTSSTHHMNYSEPFEKRVAFGRQVQVAESDTESSLQARQSQRENQRMSMRDLEVLSSIDPITTISTSTGDSECIHREGKTEILRQRDAGTEGETERR